MFIPYFTMLIMSNETERLLKMCTKLRDYNGQDPVSYWFLGTLYLQSRQTHTKGLCSLKTAIQNGISKYMPLPEEQIKRILRVSQGLLCHKVL